jgi:ankyrin repeat protein
LLLTLRCLAQLNAELVAAAKSGDATAIPKIIAQGADPDGCAAEIGEPALGWAALKGHRAAVEALLEGGASVDKFDEVLGLTALMKAAMTGRSDCLPPLLAANADITARVRGPGGGKKLGGPIAEGMSALDTAKAANKPECVAVLEAWAEGTRDPTALEAIACAVRQLAAAGYTVKGR